MSRRYRRTAAVVVVVGVALSVAALIAARRWDAHNYASEFALASENRVSVIRREIDANLSALNTLRGLAEIPDFNREKFDAISSRLLESHSSLRAVEWVDHVAAKDRARFEQEIALDGAPNPRIRQGAPGSNAMAPERAEYYPVRYLYPRTAANASAIGFDMGSCTSCRAALAESARTGRPASTVKFKILEHTGDSYAIAVMQPAYRRDPVTGALETEPRGYAMALLQVEDVVERALRYLNPQAINMQFYDESAAPGKRLLHFHRSRLAQDHMEEMSPLAEEHARDAGPLKYIRAIPVAGRPWLIVCTPTAGAAAAAHTFRPWAAFGAGLLITLIVASYFVVNGKHVSRTEQLVRDLTAANERLNLEIEVRSNTERELAAARDQALAASRLKSQFLATMSHEIRTPMNGIIGMTGLLLDSGLTQDQADYAQTVRRSGETLLTLINDILDLSKIEAGRLAVESSSFNLESVIAEVIELFAPEAAIKGIALNVGYPENVAHRFIGDAGRVRQVITNIFGNAVKFTASGSVGIRVDYPQEDNRGAIRISIDDTGIGIAPGQIGMLFQKFMQLDSSTTRKYGGAGLGLAISKQLVELMGGSIGASSNPGEGSKFWFTLPLHEDARFSENTDHPAGDAATRSARALTPAGDRIRILVAEDNMVNQKVTVMQLQKLGYRADAVSNGIEAVAAVQQIPYSIVLMDCQMPEMDGYEATGRIRSLFGRQPVIVACTASARTEDRQQCLDAGMDDYIVKPVNMGALEACLRRWSSSNSIPAAS